MSLIPILLILSSYSYILCSEGIDVSAYSAYIEWDKVKTEKQFSFIRASFGITEDSRFAENWKNAKAVGMSVGPIHFFEPGEDPEQQAQAFCWCVGELQDIPPVLDCEVSGGLSVDDYQKNVLTWLNYVENHYKITPIIYTGFSYGNTYFFNQEFAKYPLWIADWGESQPGIPGKWTTYAYWQYSGAAYVSGITGKVNLDKTK